MAQTPILKKVCSQTGLYVFLGLLAYMPLHIFLSTWIGTSLGLLTIAKVAKDVVLVVGFLATLLAVANRRVFRQFLEDRLVWFVVAYALVTLILAFVRPTDQNAEVLGVVYNLRFLLFLLYAALLVKIYPAKELQRRAVCIVLSVGLVVVLFGVLQYFLLSSTALTRIGYNRANGVLPAFFIDDKPDLERVMSTLRDPNSLGSYLLIVVGLVVAVIAKTRRSQAKFGWLLYLTLAILCLWLTFSRSALIGLVVMVITGLGVAKRRSSVLSRRMLVGLAVLLMLGFGGLYMARQTYFVQNTIFHADSSTTLEDPNHLRIRFWKNSAVSILHHPLGLGPGTAGLVSLRNKIQGSNLNENYYLQIGIEVGVIGVALFIGILALIARRLYVFARRDAVARALLISFVGLVVTNLLVHIWSSEAVAYTWWGLAGLYIPFGKTVTAVRK